MVCKYSNDDGNCELHRLTNLNGLDTVELKNNEFRINGTLIKCVKEVSFKQNPNGHYTDVTLSLDANATIDLINDFNQPTE